MAENKKTGKITYSEPAGYFPKEIMREFEMAAKRKKEEEKKKKSK